MDNTVAVAIVSAGGSVAVAITALLLNFRMFTSLERRIEIIEGDLKQFFKAQADHDARIGKLEDKGNKA
jgi:DNA-binding IclR family transcriptional regulator